MVVAGIFVGGSSSRMGGSPKGLLRTTGGITLIDRWRAIFEALEIEHVLVGRRSEYASIPLTVLDDAPSGIGPIGALAALLAYAGPKRAIAVACDMPFVTRSDVERLLASRDSVAVAARRKGRWEPLFSSYDAPRALPVVRRAIAAGRFGLQPLMTTLQACPIDIDPRHLDDWDCPQDLEGKSAS